jgi:hypothetical protein
MSIDMKFHIDFCDVDIDIESFIGLELCKCTNLNPVSNIACCVYFYYVLFYLHMIYNVLPLIKNFEIPNLTI